MTLDVRSPWFDPLRPALSALAIDPLPDADALQAALGDRVGPERFERQTKKRARGAALSMDDLYEARIARLGVIPTRTNVHDLMNALVWATFPRSKRLLARRQYAALVAQVGQSPASLPNARTRERDVLAMIDEGGVIVVEGTAPIVFGHAIYEHLAASDAPVRGFPIALGEGALPALDDRLAGFLETVDASGPRRSSVTLRRARPGCLE